MGWCECRKQADNEFEAEKRQWSWEKGYERGQGMRMIMSHDYGRCRNGKGRNVSCVLNQLSTLLSLFSFYTIISFCSSLPVNNAPWLSRFNQGSLFYNKIVHAQGQTYNLYNTNHHIFINHHTQKNRMNNLYYIYKQLCNQ